MISCFDPVKITISRTIYFAFDFTLVFIRLSSSFSIIIMTSLPIYHYTSLESSNSALKTPAIGSTDMHYVVCDFRCQTHIFYLIDIDGMSFFSVNLIYSMSYWYFKFLVYWDQLSCGFAFNLSLFFTICDIFLSVSPCLDSGIDLIVFKEWCLIFWKCFPVCFFVVVGNRDWWFLFKHLAKKNDSLSCITALFCALFNDSLVLLGKW